MTSNLTSEPPHQPARRPEDLDRFFLERANAGDVDGIVALYEPDAVLAFPPGQLTVGTEQLRKVYTDLLAGRPSFGGQIRPAIRNGELAITSSTREGNATVPACGGPPPHPARTSGASRLPRQSRPGEVARRQPDGSWLWILDQPSVLP